MTQLPHNRTIDRKISRIERTVRRQAAVIACITSLTELLMAGNTEVLAEVASLRQAIVDDQASDQAVVTALDGVIAALKAGADTTEVIAAIQEAKTQIAPVTSANS